MAHGTRGTRLCLEAMPWAFRLLSAVFPGQCAQCFSAGFFFSFMASASFEVGWGWQAPPSRLNHDLLAITVCVLATRTARRIAALPVVATDSARRTEEDVG